MVRGVSTGEERDKSLSEEEGVPNDDNDGDDEEPILLDILRRVLL